MAGSMKITGTVSTGMGKGKYFMSAPKYKEQFLGILGINSYDGTLNIKVAESCVIELKKLKGIMLNGFKREGKAFGGLSAFKASIYGVKCAVVIPQRSSHTDVIELIADRNLRESLKLKDGDLVTVIVSL